MRSDANVFPGRNAWTALGTMTIIPALIGGTLLLAGSTSSGLPGFRADDAVYTLQRTYTKGDVDRIKVKTEIHLDGSAFNGAKKVVVTLLMKEEIKEVKADGSAVINDSFEAANADFGDNNLDLTNFVPTFTQTRDKQSHILDSQSDPNKQMMGDLLSQSAKQFIAFYPAKAVKVGGSWDIDYDDSKSAVPFKTKGKGTLIAVEDHNGVQTAKIKVVTDASAEAEDPDTHKKSAVSAHFDATANMDLKTGKILTMTAKTTFKGGPLIDNAIDWKLKTGDDEDDKKPVGGNKDAAKKAEKKDGR